MPVLALVRHGESLWNRENRFTGWTDVPLTSAGEEEARHAGRALAAAGTSFDIAYTSVLDRAIRTLDLIAEVVGLQCPVIRDAALNERHYGDLQGLNKARTAERFGAEQVHLWRRSFHIAPPGGESLEDTADRALPFFERAILGDITQGKNVLVVAHGNSNRAIVMHLDELSDEEVPRLELATGVPLVYELERDGTVVDKRTLEPGAA